MQRFPRYATHVFWYHCRVMQEAEPQPSHPGSDDSLREHLLRNLDVVEACVKKYLSPQFRARQSSSDVVQSVYRQVLGYKGPFKYVGEAQFQAWLRSVVRHKIVGKARSHFADIRDIRVEVMVESQDQFGPGVGETASRIMMCNELNDAIDAAIATLSVDQREVIMLSRVCELSHAEIALQTGRDPSATRSLLHRARVRLAAALANGSDTRDSDTRDSDTRDSDTRDRE